MFLKKIVSKNLWEGKYVDLWLFGHFATGATWAFVPFFLDIPIYQSSIIFFCMIVVWEYMEHIKGVGESFANQVIDIIVGLLGVICMTYILTSYGPESFSTLFMWFVITGILTLIINAGSWLVYHGYSKIR